ncbi:Ger(x)C family spore germination protein [Paenibacillus lignilyticus]|uniref:Ger(X)C family spore germination protein n=1 Tax=Paenibacillus lignilyticus TaxID=1172615 RepID=A0ABS5CBC1_9BACL|nr:Ger(x)C family spore germination protein [Paenibacillus lignilyticus]MBP3962750.1 Ger(x)C family spore germination protein [Paenibacillus lignilyticus]
MIKAAKIGFVMLFTVLIATGCWNLEEPDQRAFVMGTGMDLNKDGKYMLSTLIAIPAGIGVEEGNTTQKSFRVLASTGKNNSDAAQKLQAQLSRSLFIGHREIVLIGEKMAEHGIADLVDEFFRNPQSEARSKIFVVKGTQAKNVFEINSMFDPYITSTLYDEQATLGLRNFYFAAFMYDALGQGTQPLLPALTMNRKKHYVYSGFAILDKDNDLKLAAYLNPEESFYTNWMKRRVNNYFMTSTVSGFEGTFSIKLRSLNRRIQTSVRGNRVKVDIQLSGAGVLVENNTNLDPSTESHLLLIQKSMNESSKKIIEQLVEKAQKQIKLDFFGFGEIVHHQHPAQWKALRTKWNVIFPQIEVSVRVNLKCKDLGETNSTIYR